MSIKRIAILSIMIILMPVLALAHEGGVSMSAAVAHYAAMAKTLANDSTEGIQEHAGEMLEFMDQHADMMKMMDEGGMKSMQGEMMGHEGMEGMNGNMEKMHEGMKEMHGNSVDVDHDTTAKTEKANPSMMMRKALETLNAKDLDLKQARSAFQELSAEFVPMAQMKYEKSAMSPTWVVMNCPMAKADWIQKKGDVKNPYYGAKMSKCGKQVCVLGAKDKGSM
jgi:hypothetical protein